MNSKTKMKQNKLIGSCPSFQKRFFGIKMLRYCTFFYLMYFFENKAYKSNFFDIESKQKRLKMLNTDRKENKNVQK